MSILYPQVFLLQGVAQGAALDGRDGFLQQTGENGPRRGAFRRSSISRGEWLWVACNLTYYAPTSRPLRQAHRTLSGLNIFIIHILTLIDDLMVAEVSGQE
jgi:hypothetical protein